MSKTEAQTRSELIDLQLALSGWNVKDPTQVVEEFDIIMQLPMGVAEARTPYEGHQFSDYVLLGKDRKPLAVIEAKKTSRDAAMGREQAVKGAVGGMLADQWKDFYPVPAGLPAIARRAGIRIIEILLADRLDFHQFTIALLGEADRSQ